MATLIIRRSAPFIRGMQSIEILIDGHRAGTIWNSQPCCVEVAPGQHTILPAKNGVSGQALDVTVTDGETRCLALNDDVSTFRQFSGLFLLAVLIMSVPDHLLHGWMFWIKGAIYTLNVCTFLYFVRTRPRNKLTITEDPVKQEKDLAAPTEKIPV